MSDNPAAVHAFAAAKLSYMSALYAGSALWCAFTAMRYALGSSRRVDAIRIWLHASTTKHRPGARSGSGPQRGPGAVIQR